MKKEDIDKIMAGACLVVPDAEFQAWKKRPAGILHDKLVDWSTVPKVRVWRAFDLHQPPAEGPVVEARTLRQAYADALALGPLLGDGAVILRAPGTIHKVMVANLKKRANLLGRPAALGTSQRKDWGPAPSDAEWSLRERLHLARLKGTRCAVIAGQYYELTDKTVNGYPLTKCGALVDIPHAVLVASDAEKVARFAPIRWERVADELSRMPLKSQFAAIREALRQPQKRK